MLIKTYAVLYDRLGQWKFHASASTIEEARRYFDAAASYHQPVRLVERVYEYDGEEDYTLQSEKIMMECC